MPPPPKNDLSVSALKSVLVYDPKSGVFKWRQWRSGLKHGRQPGSVRKDGYRHVRVFGRRYLEHRLAWLYVHGRWPAEWLDHINGDRSDNRIANLREATLAQNGRNANVKKNSSTGVKGVFPKGNKFLARISFNRKTIRLGLFETVPEAAAAYRAAAVKMDPEFARPTE